jgi:hypothetical protein
MVDALAATVGKNDEKAIREAIETLHTSYEKLNAVFE